MRLNKLALVGLLLTLALSVRAQEESESGPPGGGHRQGVMDSLLAPVRPIFDRARRLFGGWLSQSADGLDSLADGDTFRMFMQSYNKSYSPAELPRRLALFVQRRKLIEESTRLFESGKLPFVMRENPFIDWDEEELRVLTGVSLPPPSEMTPEEKAIAAQEHMVSASLGPPATNYRTPGSIGSLDPIYEIDPDPDSDHDEHDDDDEDQYDDELDDEKLNLTVRADIPASVDWRESGCVATPINQLKCGACYAIASMSVVESMRCLRQVSGPQLSPQQIVDCATSRYGYKNYGCDGGWPTPVFKYLQDTGLATRETCYPYKARQGSCQVRQVKSTSGCSVAASPSDSPPIRYKVLNNERDILYHVANTGPVVTVMKTTNAFLYYGSGIFDDARCSRRRNDVDHAIVIVGYGRENGKDYWLIKNSWGVRDWGENGYAKFKRGTNACSIGHWGWVVTN